MTTIVDARKAVYDYVIANYTGIPEARITADNEGFSAPQGLSWARISMQEETSEQETLGGVGHRWFSRRGTLFFQINVPADGGTAVADGLAKEARSLLEGVSLASGELHLFASTVRRIGPNGPWFQVSVDTAFEFTEIR